MQYDAKMLKLQKQQQNLRAQNSHSTSANNEIFRKVTIVHLSMCQLLYQYSCTLCFVEIATPTGRVRERNSLLEEESGGA